MPFDQPWEECVYHNFVIRTDRRDELIVHLKDQGVMPSSLSDPHSFTGCKDLGYKLGDFPRGENYAKTMISLPIYPELSDIQVAYIVQAVKKNLKMREICNGTKLT